MSGRTGWTARYLLRLGLLLSGVAVVWGAHEVASGSAAHAADREPPGPLTATVGVLAHTLGTVLGLPAPGTDDGGTAPAGSGDAAEAPAPGRAHDTPQRPGGPVLAAPAGRTAVGTRWVDPAHDRTPSVADSPENVATTPALPPLDGLTHAGAAPHSEAADADANRWWLPTPPHGYARPAADPLPPSRTSRPGTRPA
ncbi:hypothetical protein [Micromonospora marina]|uniref:hypothetical protein n=1 Tax=Micromonospora marina TaxID=307120 RepID=UPI003D721568